jgi:hypothetical protein
MTAAAVVTLGLLVVVPWAVWIDHHRDAEEEVEDASGRG